MVVTTHFSPHDIMMISLTLLLLFTTCQCLPQILQGDNNNRNNNNNNFRVQEGSQTNNRNQITSNSGPPRNFEGGFQPSNFGNEFVVRFPGKKNYFM